MIDCKSKRILAVAIGRGREHDFRVCKRSGQVKCLQAEIELLGDSGFQGVLKLHGLSRTPFKRSKRKPLTDEQKEFNRVLASERVVAEHVIRRLKVFRVLKEVYRHRRKRFGLRVHLLAGLYNADLGKSK
jgi:uncharacterized protein YifE (UPF0438 family)